VGDGAQQLKQVQENVMKISRSLAATVTVCALEICANSALAIPDPINDFLQTYTGPHGADLDVVSSEVGLIGGEFHLTATLNDATLERVLTVYRNAGEKKIFVHCGSGNRVGATLLPHFMIDLGMEEEDAIEQAMRVGLRSPEMLEWGLDYARRNAADTAP
jgi:hypothetical protein